MKRAFLLLAACASLCLGEAALAQGEREAQTGSLVRRPRPANIPDYGRQSRAQARVTLDRFADCIVGLRPRQALAFRDAVYDGPRAATMLRELATDQCLAAGELSMPHDLLRGAIFRNYFLREYREIDPAQIALAETPADFSRYVGTAGGQALRYRFLMQFGDCIVRADTAGVVAYVRATAGGSAEDQAFAALRPRLDPCYPAGSQLTLNRPVLTAILAEALYREAEAGRQALAVAETQGARE